MVDAWSIAPGICWTDGIQFTASVIITGCGMAMQGLSDGSSGLETMLAEVDGWFDA